MDCSTIATTELSLDTKLTYAFDGKSWDVITLEDCESGQILGKQVLRVAVDRNGKDAAEDLASAILRAGSKKSCFRHRKIAYNESCEICLKTTKAAQDIFGCYEKKLVTIEGFKEIQDYYGKQYKEKYIFGMQYSYPGVSVGPTPMDRPSSNQYEDGLTYLTTHDGYTRIFFLKQIV